MKRLLFALLLALVSPLAAQNYISAPTQVNTLTPAVTAINVQMGPYNAKPTTAADQTARIQQAINDACSVVDVGNQGAHPIVFIPSGVYAITQLTVGCSGIMLKGASITGGNPSSASALCSTAAASGTMLTVGSSSAAVTNVMIQDLQFSGFCGGFPQGIDVFCNRCVFERIHVTGYSVFGIRFLGASSLGTGGFSTVQNSEIQNGQANSFAFVLVTQTGGTGGPDGNSFINNFINTNNNFINDSTVAGATALRSSQLFLGNKFNGVNAGTITVATGQSATDRFIGNRFENTGTGNLAVVLNNTTTSDPAAIFSNNLWACGNSGAAFCTWTDNSTTKAIRFGDVMAPPSPGVLFRSASATVSGAGSPATLKTFTVTQNTLAADRTMLRVRAWGTAANNANAKAVRVEFGGVVLITLTLTLSAVDPWHCDVIIAFRTAGSAAQSVGGECEQGAALTASTVTTSTPTLDFTVSNAVRVTVTQVAAADVTQDGMLVEFIQ